MSDRPDTTRPVTVRIPAYVPGSGVTRSWPIDHPLSVRSYGNEVVIEGDKIALRALAELLLTLSEPDTPLSFHFHLEASLGDLTLGSADLVLDHDEWDE
ncbi:Imm32 family immunity protein [Streptosporangium sandarakinum]|uniref:Imm32 family immunity protein n=1 Tax=Streptosporangium sandarakinum TaxID=1260955 RepID=UPI003D921C59